MALGRDQRVIMLTGDGSFHMNLNEGCTAVSYHLPSSPSSSTTRCWAWSGSGRPASTKAATPAPTPTARPTLSNWPKGSAPRDTGPPLPPEFREALADAMKQDGPSWIDCRIGKDERVLPMIGGGDINDIIME